MSEAGINGFRTLGLLDVDPELCNYLSPDERRLVARVAIPVQTFSSRPLDVDQMLENAGAFGAVILEGMLLHRMSIGDQLTLRLLGPGDMLSRSGGVSTGILGHSSFRASGQLRLAMLDDRVLLTARRFPRLFAGLHIRLAEQHQRLAAQLAVCQLPRVEDRVLALMWLLAETWGRVTASGTVLPMTLTHDSLGELIGARRPTVTLALKELAERGSLFRQDGEWLLLEPPPRGPASVPVRGEPLVTAVAPTQWAGTPMGASDEPGDAQAPPQASIQQLVGTISALHDTHVRNSRDTRSRLERARETRAHTRSLREQIARERLTRRPPPVARRPAP